MCVVFFSYQQDPRHPLILLANRDEFYRRPTKKADYWEEFPDILAGKDLIANGTWLGVTKSGRFAAVTNFRDPGQAKGSVSRGNLVSDFLKSRVSARDYLARVQSDANQYTGFNLLVGEINAKRSELFYYSNREDEIKELHSGLYGLSNHFLDTPWKKVEKGKAVLDELIKNGDLEQEEFFKILNDKSLAEDDELPDTGIGYEREKLLSAIFIETPEYGTRCSTVLRFDENLNPNFEERNYI